MGYGIFIAFLLVCALGLGIDACAGSLTSTSKAKALVAKQYSDVKLVKKDILLAQLLGCSDDDEAHYVFRATNFRHERVTVEVCQGWPFKSATIRG